MEDRKEKYEKLKIQLKDGFEWPSVYMFKFILPADNKKLAKVENRFKSNEAIIEVKENKQIAAETK